MKEYMNEFTLGMLSQIVYDVERGAKPVGEVTVQKDIADEYVSYVERNHSVACHIKPFDDVFSTIFVIKDNRMLGIVNECLKEPITTGDHYVLGKLFGYSDAAILDWIDAKLKPKLKPYTIMRDSVVELEANPNLSVKECLKEAERFRSEHNLALVDLCYKGFTMTVDGEEPLEGLEKECVDWLKNRNLV